MNVTDERWKTRPEGLHVILHVRVTLGRWIWRMRAPKSLQSRRYRRRYPIATTQESSGFLVSRAPRYAVYGDI